MSCCFKLQEMTIDIFETINHLNKIMYIYNDIDDTDDKKQIDIFFIIINTLLNNNFENRKEKFIFKKKLKRILNDWKEKKNHDEEL